MTLRLVALLIGAALFLSGCRDQNRATVTLSEFQIRPKGVEAAVGRPITLTIVNAGKIEHNLALEASAIDAPLLAQLQAGQRATVTFTPKSSGTFQYVCTIPGHAPAGMQGSLVVA